MLRESCVLVAGEIRDESPGESAMDRSTTACVAASVCCVPLASFCLFFSLPSFCVIFYGDDRWILLFLFFPAVSSRHGSRWIRARAIVIKVPGDVWRRSSLLCIGRWIWMLLYTEFDYLEILNLIASGRLFLEWDNQKYEARASENSNWFLLFSLFCSLSLYEGRDVALIILETFNVVSSLEWNIWRSELTSSSFCVFFSFFFSWWTSTLLWLFQNS